MLVITRKNNESFFVGDDVEIVILESSKDKVKIGIKAPKEIKITRNEIKNTEIENKQAINTPDVDTIKKLFANNERND